MDNVLETLMDACGSLGKTPASPFRDVRDFEAQVLEWFPAAGEREKSEQLTWVLMAVHEAEVRRVRGVVACIKRVQGLS
ncbi:MAG TPA: hypothetical protein VF316_02675 [Polyangiaceae bacterium]